MRPRERRVWLFNCAGTFEGNPKWLFLYVNRFRPDIEAWWVSGNPPCVDAVRALGFRAMSYDDAKASGLQRRAGVWVVNQVKEHIPADMAGITMLNLWHGVGVKSIERGMNEGYLHRRIAAKYIRNNAAYHNTQLFLVTSPMMEKHFRRHIGLAEDRVIRAGYPQNLYAALHGTFASFDHDLRLRQGLPAETRIALYAPTPRRTGHATFLADALPDLPRLVEVLRREGILLIIKMHPHLTKDAGFHSLRLQYGNEPHLMFWNNDEDIYEVFDQVDLAVIDYSSIFYDLLAAGTRQAVRYVFDHDDGNDVLEPGVDYFALSAGKVARTFDDLLAQLAQDCTIPGDEVEHLLESFWSYADDTSLERIVEAALAFEPTQEQLPSLHSFDVFDTIIQRQTVEPRGIFFAVRHQLERHAPDFPSYLVANFPRIRADAESNVRQDRAKRPELVATGDLEITLDDIYDRIASIHGLGTEQRQRVRQWEIDAELANVLPRPRVVDEVHELLDQGEEVILISDMYLPIEVVQAMIARVDPRIAGLSLYLSNDRRAQKTTGRLYLAVYEDRPWTYGAWYHAGDSHKADVLNARQLGIRTRKLDTPAFSPLEKRLVDSVDTYDAHVVAGMLFRQRRIARPEWTTSQAFAYRNVALYLTPYLEWVVQHAVDTGLRRLYFIARDGHFMRPLAAAIIARRGLDIETRYIYGSRRAWRLASQADGVDDETFSEFGAFAGLATLEEFAETSGLTLVELRDLVPGLASTAQGTRLDTDANAAVRRQLAGSAGYRRHLEQRAAKDRDLVVDYLRQEIDVDQPHAFVEYWGRGYTQDCLVRLVEQAWGRPRDVAFYYARSIYLTEGRAIRYNFTSSATSMLFIEAILANLPYGTVEGYRRTAGGVVPVIAYREHDLPLASAMSEELPRFADDLAALELMDRDRTLRDLYDFAFRDAVESSDRWIYVDNIAHLKDAVRLGEEESEFAPALTLQDFADYATGRRDLASMTRNYAMSAQRTGGLARHLFRWGTTPTWRRRIARARNLSARARRRRVR